MLQLLDNAVIDAPTEKGNYGSLVIKIATVFSPEFTAAISGSLRGLAFAQLLDRKRLERLRYVGV